jgi:hypothetical protein
MTHDQLKHLVILYVLIGLHKKEMVTAFQICTKIPLFYTNFIVFLRQLFFALLFFLKNIHIMGEAGGPRCGRIY